MTLKFITIGKNKDIIFIDLSENNDTIHRNLWRQSEMGVFIDLGGNDDIIKIIDLGRNNDVIRRNLKRQSAI